MGRTAANTAEQESPKDLVFAPLGGLGEIGMNAGLYGFGPPDGRKWILVDCGMSFGNEELLPGIDVIFPDIRFLEEERDNLLGIVITHAHEDHIGALTGLWPRLQVPVYATKFAMTLLEARRLTEPGAPKIILKEVLPRKPFKVGPFSLEYIPVSHSIPESNAVVVRTPLGTVLHSGDWKIDNDPVIGVPTDSSDFQKLSQEGVLAIVCDSTNAISRGTNPSERDVSDSMVEIMRGAGGRVCITTFASNVARLKGIADAAKSCGRKVLLAGRSLERIVNVARECGYLDNDISFLPLENFARLPRDKVVLVMTGSQGESRAALSRIAAKQHPDVKLASGDLVIFSARTIPGNERTVSRIINQLVEQGVNVITERDALVHTSGHPKREELKTMYRWVSPRIAIPAHGEMLHLSEQAALAREMGVPRVKVVRNGEVIRIAPGDPEIIDDVPSGRLYKDGEIVIDESDPAVSQRRKLSFSGIVSVAFALDRRGNVVGEPLIDMKGLPEKKRNGENMIDAIADTVDDVLNTLPHKQRLDPDVVENAVHKAVRSTVKATWGKKPFCHVLVIEV
jgi:ribonuclease J